MPHSPAINDRETQDRLVRENVGLIHGMARRFGKYLTDEKLSDGMYALAMAARSFDASRGFAFSTYACRCILQQWNNTNKLDKAHERRVASATERHERRQAEQLRHRSVRHEAGELPFDWESLDVRERAIVEMRASGMTLQEVGDLLGLSKERVRQIANKAMKKMIGFRSDSPTISRPNSVEALPGPKQSDLVKGGHHA